MGNPHILAIPYPAQGHVIPLMELSHRLVDHGFSITFVNTDFNHKRVRDSFGDRVEDECSIRLVSIPDGMEPGEDRNHLGKLTDGITNVMPPELRKLLKKINGVGDDKISYVIADVNMGWALDIAAEFEIPGVAFWPASAFLLALLFSTDKLLDDQVIDEHGTPINGKNMIQLCPNTPAMHPKNFLWVCLGDLTTQKKIFEFARRNNKAVENVEWLICNTTFDLEPGAFSLIPEILPIGPLLANNQHEPLTGSFWPEDETCLKWLDQQRPGSVIYVAFGSFTVFDPIQFQELALGLEHLNRPFLWVVRPDMTEGTRCEELYPKGFKARVGSRGKMVGWAPQRAVLAHPSIACFISHCGWNSTVEGLSNRVPFLCWPYFADQFINETYICEIWKIGLSFKRDEREIITREEIKSKIEQLVNDESFKEKALKLKGLVMNSVDENGSSNRIFKNFIEWMKS
ncbi:putative UDP-Glycosyltransferase superfamily protein [Hibiscus syriacus]|uniref:UDP-Glycosyltransferase superfamily protein n=1 Tax=Hibiscus syriacus TaxID=106335 RepID=A0A6A2XS77_HIBSY|nr:UDP-glycosyltransferase 83A1-like [Hibiscus syriacus]KAE8678462.1 putative UDP-Glycosyltransferase superfamily protein [Hibiscus syriacus]